MVRTYESTIKFKYEISNILSEWKHSNGVEYISDNPKPTADEVIQTWIVDAQKRIYNSYIENSNKAAGFNEDPLCSTCANMMYMVKDSRMHGKALVRWKQM